MRMLLTLGIAWSILNHFNHITLTVQASSSIDLKCPTNTYKTGPGKCAVCSKCDRYSVERRPCTKRRDRVCLTCNGDAALQRPACRRCPPCPEGQFVSLQCTRESLTVCKTCPRGSFNPRLSYSSRCTPCTSCYRQNRVEATMCTASTDTVCGHCKKGYYSEHGSYRCIPCQACVRPGQMSVQKCQDDGTGKECSQIVRYIFRHTVINEPWADGQEVVEEVTRMKLSLSSRVDSSTVKTTTIDENTTTDRAAMIIFVGLIPALFIMVIVICIVIVIFGNRNLTNYVKPICYQVSKEKPNKSLHYIFRVLQKNPKDFTKSKSECNLSKSIVIPHTDCKSPVHL